MFKNSVILNNITKYTLQIGFLRFMWHVIAYYVNILPLIQLKNKNITISIASTREKCPN